MIHQSRRIEQLGDLKPFRIALLEAERHARLAGTMLEAANLLCPVSELPSAVAHRAVQSRVLAETMERHGIPAKHEITVIELSEKLLKATPSEAMRILKDHVFDQFHRKLEAKILAAIKDITGHVEGQRQSGTTKTERGGSKELRDAVEKLTDVQRAAITKKIVYLAAARPIIPGDPRLGNIRDTLLTKSADVSMGQIDALRSWVTMRIRTFLGESKATLPREVMPEIVHAVCKAAKPSIAQTAPVVSDSIERQVEDAIEYCSGLVSRTKVERAVQTLINVYKPYSFQIRGLSQEEIGKMWRA